MSAAGAGACRSSLSSLLFAGFVRRMIDTVGEEGDEGEAGDRDSEPTSAARSAARSAPGIVR